MARQRGAVYESDEARKRIKAHVRVHLSLQNHPRTVGLYENNDLLAAWLRVMVLASDRGAAHTGDWVCLSRPDIERVSGKRRADVARTLLERLANVLGWLTERRGHVLAIHVRNFAKKQNIAPRDSGVTPRDPAASTTTTTTTEKNIAATQLVDDASPTLKLEPSTSPNGKHPKPEVTVPEIVEAWRKVCVSRGAPDVRELTSSREQKLRQRIREHPTFDWWDELFNRMARSQFLFGHGDRGWRVTLDWLVANDRNAVKILEGRYES